MALPPVEGISPSVRVSGQTQDRVGSSESGRASSGRAAPEDSVELSEAALKKLDAARAADDDTARQTAADIRDALADNTEVTLGLDPQRV